jgi:hypothetical protein
MKMVEIECFSYLAHGVDDAEFSVVKVWIVETILYEYQPSLDTSDR